MSIEKFIDCPTHGPNQLVVDDRSSGGFSHQVLACDCVVEIECEVPIQAGDVVLFNSQLWRVDSVSPRSIGGDFLTLINVNGECHTYADVVDYVGKDTLSGLKSKTCEFSVGDLVWKSVIDQYGTVVEVISSDAVKCRVTFGDGVKYFVWNTVDLTLSYKASKATPVKKSYAVSDWKKQDYGYKSEWDDACASSTTWKQPTAKPILPPTKKTSISTADLIKEEVRSLEAEEKKSAVRHLRTNAPVLKEPEDKEPSTEASVKIPKRRGDW
jgi:hypothetical protein